MQIAHLEVFLAVVREGSFAGAAKRLWIAPSRVTERIQQLERELRVDLFVRSGRQLISTQAGLALIPRAQALVREMELIKTLFPEDDVPEVRLGMRSLPTDVRDRIQHKLNAVVGKARLTVLPLDSKTQIELMLTGRLDCGLVWNVPPPPLQSLPVLSEAFAIAVPANDRYFSLDVIRPEDLSGLRLASIVDPLSVPAAIAPYLEHLPTVDLVNPAVAHATYLLVSGGRHCAFVAQNSTDHHALSSDQRNNILVKPLLPPVPELRTYFVWRPDLEQSPFFAPVLDQIRRLFPTEERR